MAANHLTATEKWEETRNSSVQLNNHKQRKKSYIPISYPLTTLNQ